jgi:hypothetical protein
MKRKSFLIITLFICFRAFTQVTPEAFLGMLPALPKEACAFKMDARNSYLDKVNSLSELIDNEISRRHMAEKANAETNNQQAMNNMAQQYGLSPEDMEKMKSGKKMTDEEKRALADKMLQQNNNMSMDEVDNLKKMDKDGKKAWAEGYSTEMMAVQAADPQKSQEMQLKAKNIYELAALQKHILDSLLAISSKFSQQLSEIENDSLAKVMRENISKWHEELMSLTGIDYGQGGRMDELARKIKAEKGAYCQRYTPRYMEILKNCEAFTRSGITACYRVEKITARLTKLQTGVDLNIEPGEMGITSVHDYVTKLRDVFKYNLFNASDEQD